MYWKRIRECHMLSDDGGGIFAIRCLSGVYSSWRFSTRHWDQSCDRQPRPPSRPWCLDWSTRNQHLLRHEASEEKKVLLWKPHSTSCPDCTRILQPRPPSAAAPCFRVSAEGNFSNKPVRWLLGAFTAALVTVKSISPLAAPMSVVNLSQTPCNIPRRLLLASVLRKFFTVSPLSWAPICRCSSWTICDLSLGLKVGALSIEGSFPSFLSISARTASDFDVLSSEDVLAAAVYYSKASN